MTMKIVLIEITSALHSGLRYAGALGPLGRLAAQAGGGRSGTCTARCACRDAGKGGPEESRLSHRPPRSLLSAPRPRRHARAAVGAVADGDASEPLKQRPAPRPWPRGAGDPGGAIRGGRPATLRGTSYIPLGPFSFSRSLMHARITYPHTHSLTHTHLPHTHKVHDDGSGVRADRAEDLEQTKYCVKSLSGSGGLSRSTAAYLGVVSRRTRVAYNTGKQGGLTCVKEKVLALGGSCGFNRSMRLGGAGKLNRRERPTVGIV